MRSIEQPGRSLLSLATLAALAALPAITGCRGYTSSYTPLVDGRARPVYRDDKLVMEIGNSISPACEDAIAEPRSAASSTYVAANTRVGLWVPVYFGPRIVVVRRGVAPAPRRPAYVGWRSASGRSGASPSWSGSGGGGGGSSGGGSGIDKEAAVILAVIAIVALPAITLGLALGRPEPEKEVADVLDRVNLYNDLVRSPESPCAVAAPGAPGAPNAPMGGAP